MTYDAQGRAGAEQARLNDMMAVSSAEGIVGAARIGDLHAAQQAAWRRVSAMKGQVTRAIKDGSAERIRTAEARYDAARREADALADAGIKEMCAVLNQGNAGLAAVYDQVTITWDAQAAALRETAGPGTGSW